MITDEQLQKLFEALLENQPRVTSDRYNVGDTDTIAGGAQLTVTFTLDPSYVVRLVRAYADARAACTYVWWIDGRPFLLNEVEFYMGKPVTGDNITLVIANTGIPAVVISYYLYGWGDLKSGG